MAHSDPIRLLNLEMADPQLYITVAIFVAVTAIVTTYIREKELNDRSVR